MAPRSDLDVMLIADDDDTRASVQDFLELQRYSVAAFASARQALESLAHQRPRLLLLDLQLEELSGWELVAERRRTGQDAPPIVVISGLHKAEVDAALLGAVEVLRKPLDLRRLQAVVERCCGRREDEGEGAE